MIKLFYIISCNRRHVNLSACVWIYVKNEMLHTTYRNRHPLTEICYTLFTIQINMGLILKSEKHMMIQFTCYRKCSTCRKVIQLLRERGVDFAERQIDLERPTEEELRRWHQQSGLPLKHFFNTSGIKYREMQLTKRLSDMPEDEQYALLATDGMLVKRPILLAGDAVVVGADVIRWIDQELNS